MSSANKKIFEVILFTSLYIGAGILFSADDPLLTRADFSYSVIFLSIITLFFGLVPGLSVLASFCVTSVVFYSRIPYFFLFENLLFTFIFGEFYFYWNRMLSKAVDDRRYFNIKLKELSKAFYSLKVSHDQLEKNYILKPVSIRSLLDKIKDIYRTNKRNAYKELILLFSRYFGVERAAFFQKIGDEFTAVASIGTHDKIDMKNELVRTAIEELVAAYISKKAGDKSNEGDYLAVIPALTDEDKVEGILVIYEMPFLSFNKGNLETISVLLSYFVDQSYSVETAKPLKDKYPFFSDDMLTEISRLSLLNVRHGIESVIVTVTITGSHLKDSLKHIIEQAIRSSDLHQVFETDTQASLILVMPMAGDSSVTGFINRVTEIVKKKIGAHNAGDMFSYRVIKINELNKTAEQLSYHVNNLVASHLQN